MPKPNGARRRRRVDPGGRPRQILVRVTEEEWERIAQRASEMGLTPASYLAEIGQAAVPGTAIGTSPGEAAGGLVVEQGRPLRVLERRAVAAELLAVRRMFSGAVNNLNQLAKVANSTGRLAPPQVAAAAGLLVRYLPRLDAVVAALDPRWRPGGSLA